MSGRLSDGATDGRAPGHAGPGVLFAPAAHAALRRGVDCMANLVRPTLGPTPRCVVVADAWSGRGPEALDDAATIVRRVVEIPNPYANMGAMLLRHAVWRTAETVGDGAATTAVLFQAIVRHASAYLGAGGDAVALRRGLERGLAIATATLTRLATPLEGPADIVRAADALCQDSAVATLLGEIFDIVGVDGHVQVEDGYTEGVQRRYVEGACWDEGYLSPYFATGPHGWTARLEGPAILISDLRLTAGRQIAPLLDRLAAAEQRSLLIIAREVSGSALGTLVANHRRGTLRLLAVGAPSYGAHQAHILEDMASLTGGRVVTEAGGGAAESVTLADLGHAQAVWADMATFGIRGGRGNPGALRRRIAQVKAEHAAAGTEEERGQARERLGKLMGGVAILEVGAATATQREIRKAAAQRATTVLREALRGGVAPGGGAAYLACRPALHRASPTPDERVAFGVLGAALAEPMRVIAANAGYDPATVVARVEASPAGWGFDACTGRIVDMRPAGIVDAVRVLRTALEVAASGAIMALSSDVLVHQRAPKMVARP